MKEITGMPKKYVRIVVQVEATEKNAAVAQDIANIASAMVDQKCEGFALVKTEFILSNQAFKLAPKQTETPS